MSSRPLILSLVVIFFGAGNVATAADSKAQLHLPWTLVEKQITSSLLAEDSSISDVTPSLQINVGGVAWNLTNLMIATRVPSDAVSVTPLHAEISGNNVPISIKVGTISVDQVVDQVVQGVLVHIHVQGSCGPLTLTQKKAHVAARFDLKWMSGSPQSTLENFELAWAPMSWTLASFNCEAPQGTPDLLHQIILERISNADDFKPYVESFIRDNANASLQQTLTTIRKPFSAAIGSSKQSFSVGVLQPVASGVVADITVSDNGAHVTKPKALPSSNVLQSLSKTQPSLLAGKEVLQQILDDAVAAQPAYTQSDLQDNADFHDFMGNRFAQFFAWEDLLHFSSDAPFPVTIYKPKAPLVSLTDESSLQGSVTVQAVVQAYRNDKWWTWIDLTGTTLATVKLTVAAGKVTYATTLDQTKLQSVYAPDYKDHYQKTGSPPVSKLSSAIDGVQKSLSGSFLWPTANLGAVGSYTVNGLKWLSPTDFVLTWAKK